eukprot:scaffold56312_cov29-Tisochrysis_lutea.AAC.2
MPGRAARTASLKRGGARGVAAHHARAPDALVAEDAPELVDAINATDNEPLEVELGRDAQREFEACSAGPRTWASGQRAGLGSGRVSAPSALWYVSKGLASAPPGCALSAGVSISRKPRSSR